MNTGVLSVQSDKGSMPLAVVQGKPVTETPGDLYIPPEALRVFLESFEGPLDLLLYFIKRHDFDILNISIARITAQYMEYIELMQEMKLELAGEYLVMAALLAEIKARSLLPKHEEIQEDEEDPRAELIRRLQEYEQFRLAAENLDDLPRVDRDIFPVQADHSNIPVERPKPVVSMEQLVKALQEVMTRAKKFADHHVRMEALSVRERMTSILDRLGEKNTMEFKELFTLNEGRNGVIVSFLAILELIKESLIHFHQSEPLSPIHVSLISHE
ncbi:MAG: segregation/condensation protein A [Gammaproteobacteria bacterium]|nr:MAG: segregation/condensation protein A [Gammaproteobacteria bacterium]